MSDATSALGARVLGGIYDTPYTLYIASSGGEAGDQHSSSPSLSADASHIAFGSAATNLTDLPPTRFLQIYVRDLASGRVQCKSLAPDGRSADGNCFHPHLSADGSHLVFHSEATNLASTSARQPNVFLRQGEQTLLISQTPDGRAASGSSSYATVCADGSRVAFQSDARDLVEDDGGGECDIFVRHIGEGRTERITRGPGRCAVPVISADGRFVVFQSTVNNSEEILIRDLKRPITTRVSVASDGRQANGSCQDADISADGRYVVFASRATNLDAAVKHTRQVYRHDRDSGETRCVSLTGDGLEPNGNSYLPVISPDGRYVAFGSFATNLVKGDSDPQTFDVFLHDCHSGSTVRLNEDALGKPLPGAIWNRPTLSDNAARIAFCSTVPRAWRATQVCLAEKTVLKDLLQPKPALTVEKGHAQVRIGGVSVPVRTQPPLSGGEESALLD